MNKEIFKAAQKRFEETIVFVPFYNGHKLAMKKHVEFVNRLGYDAVVFDLTWSFTKPISSLAYLPYSFGSNLIDKVMISGEWI